MPGDSLHVPPCPPPPKTPRAQLPAPSAPPRRPLAVSTCRERVRSFRRVARLSLPSHARLPLLPPSPPPGITPSSTHTPALSRRLKLSLSLSALFLSPSPRALCCPAPLPSSRLSSKTEPLAPGCSRPHQAAATRVCGRLAAAASAAGWLHPGVCGDLAARPYAGGA